MKGSPVGHGTDEAQTLDAPLKQVPYHFQCLHCSGVTHFKLEHSISLQTKTSVIVNMAALDRLQIMALKAQVADVRQEADDDHA